MVSMTQMKLHRRLFMLKTMPFFENQHNTVLNREFSAQIIDEIMLEMGSGLSFRL